MKISRNAAGLAALAMALAGGAAIGQDSPESLLPPGFNDPVAAPPPAAAPAPAPTVRPVAGPVAVAPGAPTPTPSASATPGEIDLAELAKYELPDFARRSLNQVGGLDAAGDTLPPSAFGDADGRYLGTLMRRLRAPIASRWLSIGLRRALLSPLDTPAHVNGADFAAERAWLLLRMGEANAARGVVQAVDIENYTPKLFQVGMQASLAASDPAGICPMVEPAMRQLRDQSWSMARAYCTGLSGDASKAGPLLDGLRRRGVASPFDLMLAEKVMGTGVQGRRAVTIEWDSITDLTAWRYGLATATVVEVPERLYTSANPRVRYWMATAPGVSARARVAAAEAAATQGVFSSQGLVDLYGEIEETEDSGLAEVAVARDVRTASSAADFGERISTLKQLWEEAKTPRARYGRLILTSGAAARVVPDAKFVEESPRLIASMLSSGRDIAAARWDSVVERGGDGWALLAVGSPGRGIAFPYGDVDAYRAAADARKAQMLVAGLAGLGRVSETDAERLVSAMGVEIGVQNAWTQAIAQAAARNQPGTVLLLAAAAMQTPVWGGVAPEALFHITAALRRVGLESYARMIAAEAISRL